VTRWFSVKQLVAVLAIGLVIGYGAFAVTGQESDRLLLPPECRLVVAAGFDPITGLPHGATVECAQLTGLGGQLPVAQVNPMAPDLASRRAIPVPLGLVVGVGLAFGVLAVRKVRRQPSDDHVVASSAKQP
jgi:hypothetical protein